MNFRTAISIPTSKEQIQYGQKILAMGSCFADRMGERMAASKLDTLVNTLGISYNPLSLARLLKLSLKGKIPPYQFADHMDQWCSFDLHSQFNQLDEETFVSEVLFAQGQVSRRLTQIDWLILTFGTAWAYYHPHHPNPVNNNHRYPGHEFNLELIEVDEIVETWKDLLDLLWSVNPNMNVVMTVSPIRHIRHTIPGNSVSKSTLRLACHHLSQLPHVHYFPSFEIMMDDLRDYRFYSDDMLHPTELAEAYIWDRFADTYFSSGTLTLMQDLESAQRDLNHRARTPGSRQHKAFLNRLENKLNTLQTQGLDMDQELWRIREMKGYFG